MGGCVLGEGCAGCWVRTERPLDRTAAPAPACLCPPPPSRPPSPFPQEYINIELDAGRNRLIRLDIVLTAATFAFAPFNLLAGGWQGAGGWALQHELEAATCLRGQRSERLGLGRSHETAHCTSAHHAYQALVAPLPWCLCLCRHPGRELGHTLLPHYLRG